MRTTVPYTGKRRRYRFFRRPRSLAALRAGTRPGAEPPTAWDDIARRPERAWKAFRRTRWKHAAPSPRTLHVAPDPWLYTDDIYIGPSITPRTWADVMDGPM